MNEFNALLLKVFQEIDLVSKEEMEQLISTSSECASLSNEEIAYLVADLEKITLIPDRADGVVDNLIRVVEDLEVLGFVFDIGFLKMNSVSWFDLYEYAYVELNQFMTSDRLPNFSPRGNIHKYLSEIQTNELTTQELEFLAFVLYRENPGDLDTALALGIIRDQKSYSDFEELRKLSSFDFLKA